MAKQPDRKRVVITGLGAVSPNGIGGEEFATACAHGRSGIERTVGIDLHDLKTSAVGQVRGFDLGQFDPVEARRVPRMVLLSLSATRDALASAGLEIDPKNLEQQRTIGVALGTGGGGIAFVEDQYKAYYTQGKPSLFSITAGTHGNLSSEISIALHLRGPSHVLSTGCTSSTDAIAYAALLIREGGVSAMIAGGADAPIAPGILCAFEKMKVVSTRAWDDPAKASRPFTRDRDGFVLGEGAWMFLLEDRETAIARNAPILAEIAGYGSTCDAYHRVQIAPDVVEPVRAIELALADANVAKDEV